jgi:hypothetical protein
MTLPGFTAEGSLSRRQRTAGAQIQVRGLAADTEKVIPQFSWSCFDACQDNWSHCVSSCAWWEWGIGTCLPKCRVLWAGCLTHC